MANAVQEMVRERIGQRELGRNDCGRAQLPALDNVHVVGEVVWRDQSRDAEGSDVASQGHSRAAVSDGQDRRQGETVDGNVRGHGATQQLILLIVVLGEGRRFRSHRSQGNVARQQIRRTEQLLGLASGSANAISVYICCPYSRFLYNNSGGKCVTLTGFHLYC